MKQVRYEVHTRYGFFPAVCPTLKRARFAAKFDKTSRIKRVTTITETVKPHEVR